MVNVNTPLPFNLHNRSLHQRLDMSSSRSDHSISEPTSPVRPLASTSETRLHITVEPPKIRTRGRGTRPSPSPSRDPSPSLETSRSTSSLHPGDASYLPPEEDPEHGARRPILNVRLVRHYRAAGAGQAHGIRMRMGRSATRGRMGRFGDEPGGAGAARGREAEAGEGVGDAQDRTPRDPASELLASRALGSDRATPTNAASALKMAVCEDKDKSDPTTPVVSTFKIRDVGKLSQSWGD